MQDAVPANLFVRYNGYFRAQAADTPSLIRTAQALRYQVYCLERGFEKACAQEDCLERDAFDNVAVHSLIFHRPTADAIGTARLILPRPDAMLPFEKLLAEKGLRAGDAVPLRTTAEVSRFAISNQFRRRRAEFETDDVGTRREPECRSSLPCLGLIQDLVRQSLAQGLTHWAAVMEPKLLRMLAAMGIHFTPLGPLVSHHGLRQPSYCCLGEMLERLGRERPDHWMVVTDAGSLVPESVEHRRAA
jgi:N-acyl amino acid synthase of PEP-CTERM/exosortase system